MLHLLAFQALTLLLFLTVILSAKGGVRVGILYKNMVESFSIVSNIDQYIKFNAQKPEFCLYPF